MDENEFANLLMSEERRKWQNPEMILSKIESIRTRSIVADLACGPGFFTVPILKKVGREGKVYAVDSSPVMLSRLKSAAAKFHNLAMIRSDICERSSIPSGSVEVVLLANVLHDIEKKEALFREIARILKKSQGEVVLIDWKKEEYDFGPPVEIRISEKDAEKILKGNGLKIKRRFSPGSYHYGLICSIGF